MNIAHGYTDSNGTTWRRVAESHFSMSKDEDELGTIVIHHREVSEADGTARWGWTLTYEGHFLPNESDVVDSMNDAIDMAIGKFLVAKEAKRVYESARVVGIRAIDALFNTMPNDNDPSQSSN